MVLTAIFVMGISGLWAMTASQTRQLVLDQKAVFVLNAETERLTALYDLTPFADPASCGLVSGLLSGLLGGSCSSSLASYGVYVGDMSNFATSNFVTSTAATFAGNDFLVYAVTYNGNNSNFVWIDRGRRLMGMLSWADSNIPQTANGSSWQGKCWAWAGGSGSALCKTLTVTLQYPYRLNASNAIEAIPNPKTLTLMTVVGRRR